MDLKTLLADRLVDGVTQGKLEEKFFRYQENPEDFMTEVLHVENLWSKLAEICNSVRDNRITVVKSANSIGKTYIAARITLWFLQSFPAPCKVITTAAPPERQIKELLWGELRYLWQEAVAREYGLLPAKLSSMALEINPKWFAKGFTIPQTGSREDRISRFSGHHAEHMLHVVDEASGVSEEIFTAIESCMSGEHNHLLLLANPMVTAGSFYEYTLDPSVNVIEVSAFDHPNVMTGEDIIPGCVTRKLTVERILKWSRELRDGEEPDTNCFEVPEFLSEEVPGKFRKVTNPALFPMTLGEYPGQSEHALIPSILIRQAMDRWVDNPPEIEGIAGQDVAETGVDANTWIVRRDYWTSEITRWSDIDADENARKVESMAKKHSTKTHPIKLVSVDGIGVGAGIAPYLNRKEIDAAHVKVSSSPTANVDEGEFKILRDQLLWAVAEWLKSEKNAMLPPDPLLAQELTYLTYHHDVQGKIRVMSKSELRKIIKRSSDSLDALMMTFYIKKKWRKLKMVKI